MAVLIDTRTGPIVQADGAGDQPLRQGRLAALVVSDGHPRYYEQALRQATFFAATQAGQTTTVGLATTYVGLVLSNPIGNTKLLVPTKVTFGWGAVPAAVDTVGIALGYNATSNVTHTTPVTPRSTYFGSGPTPTALADTSATLPTAPFYYAFLGNTPTATTSPNGAQMDLEGSVIIPPGGYILTATTAASQTTAFFASIQWEEIVP